MAFKILTKSCLVACFSMVLSYPGIAQIVPDNTLGTESSVINSIDELRERISGGATRGGNLFHMFQEFNIGEGKQVYFANPEGISNIFSTVTGNKISDILGTLGVEGTAHLFFINPNCIVFGENAQIDVVGSFIATTANRVDFNDGTSFTVRDENQKPILTWSAPIGLGLDSNNGSIIVNGTGHQLTSANRRTSLGSPIAGGASGQIGLKVTPDNTLALIGSGINIDGGVVTSPSGNIEIGSVERGNIKLDLTRKDISFDYSKVVNFADIQLDNYALLDASGFLGSGNSFASGGIINLYGKNLLIDNGSLIFISNLGESLSSGINVTISESAILTGITSPSTFGQGRQEVVRGLLTQNLSHGQGANISISAENLTLKNFSLISSVSYGEGAGGNITDNSEKDEKAE